MHHLSHQGNPAACQQRIAELREAIALHDLAIVRAVQARMGLIAELSECKQALGLAVRDLEVEAEVHERAERLGGELGLDAELTHGLFRVLIDAAVRGQVAARSCSSQLAAQSPSSPAPTPPPKEPQP